MEKEKQATQRKANGRKKTKVQRELELRKQIEKELTESQRKTEKIFNVLFDIVDTIAMIIAASAGILLSKYIPAFRSGEEINFVLPSWGRLIISFALAMGVVGTTQIKGNRAGKKKNFLPRIWFSFANGLTWHTILGF